MRIAEVIGTVTLSRCHESFVGCRLKLAVPLALSDLKGETEPAAESLVIYDDIGAGVGDRIAFTEGGEATQPFRPLIKPVDAYNAAILDTIDLHIE